MNDLAGLNETPDKGIFSFKTNEDVLNMLQENEGLIGVVVSIIVSLIALKADRKD
jgi:phosphate transport system substrate-binding protein